MEGGGDGDTRTHTRSTHACARRNSCDQVDPPPLYFQCTILRQVVVVMGAGIGKSVKYRSESPSRRTSASVCTNPFCTLVYFVQFPWTYDEREVCWLLEGEVTVTPTDGRKPATFGKGDLVTFPAGVTRSCSTLCTSAAVVRTFVHA
jgi:mannose-6-phosphate isomerase-like protein (cupin superfamily)